MKYLTEAMLQQEIRNDRLCVSRAGKVYDVTEFADRHPGGRDLLESRVGKDVTGEMKRQDIHVHSVSAYKMMDKYCIGELQLPGATVQRRTKTSEESGAGEDELSDGRAYRKNEEGYMVHDVEDDKYVDWSKPLLWQVGKLGDKYFDWVHSPTDHPIRLFKSDFFEFFSGSPWYLVLLYWVPILCMLMKYTYSDLLEKPVYWGLIGREMNVSHYPLLFVLGFLMWTLDEYVIHRWLFHLRPIGNWSFFITLHFLFHGQHHKSPMDKWRLVFPALPATLLGSLFYNVYRLLFPPTIRLILFSGTIMGYICYDMIHYYLHHGTPVSAYFKELKTYHVKHHFSDQQRGFGISSKLWDYPFGTLIK